LHDVRQFRLTVNKTNIVDLARSGRPHRDIPEIFDNCIWVDRVILH